MKSLPATIRKELMDENNWVICKTPIRFSVISFDRAKKEGNKTVKGICLAENPTTYRRWMLSGPEIAGMVNEFTNQNLIDIDDSNQQP